MFDATNKSVLVTGCSSGIGRATALRLAKSGFTVFASVRKAKDRDDLAKFALRDLVPLYPLDLGKLTDIPPMVESLEAELRRRGQAGLYALVNNAGGGSVAPIELMDLEGFRMELEARLVGSVALVQALLPLLRAGGGRIVWIATPAIIPTSYVASIHMRLCDQLPRAHPRYRTPALEYPVRPGAVRRHQDGKGTPDHEGCEDYPPASQSRTI
jgi:NAD(P)-dependent dehydrogenase (short-subunit alcohol dehydrogenase family)